MAEENTNNKNIMEKISRSLLIEGILLTAFGFLILIWPNSTIEIVIKIIAALLLLIGAIGIAKGISDLIKKDFIGGIGKIALSILAIILGIIMLKYPGVYFATLIILFGIWLILRGLFELFSSSAYWRRSYKIFSIIVGILDIIAGILLLFKPITAGIILFWVLGIYALIAGPIMIASAVLLRPTKEREF